MRSTSPRSPHSLSASAVGGLLLLTACHAPAPSDDVRPRVGPRPVDDQIGASTFAPEASVVRSLCPPGVGCSTADVNRDGKDDLVRFDSLGVVSAPGTVEVAYSNGWDFGPMRPVAEGVCVDESGCTIADVDGDGIPDLVRFIRQGEAAEVEVYQGAIANLDHDLLFTTPSPWTQGLCALGEQCSAADVDGDGLADLIAISGGQDGLVRVSLSTPSGGASPSEWASGRCVGDPTRCRIGDVDGDGIADLLEVDAAGGSVWVSPGQAQGGFGSAQSWLDNVDLAGVSTVLLADFDGDFDTDLITIGSSSVPVDPASCEGSCGSMAPSGCWCDELCTQYGDCCDDHASACSGSGSCEDQCDGPSIDCWCDELCGEYGDCCNDYDAWCAGASSPTQVRVWPAMGSYFGPVLTLDTHGCDGGALCWAADVTGDGRADLLSADPDGTVTLLPSEDTVDRLERDAMRLSLLRADWHRRRRARARVVYDDIITEAAPVPPQFAGLPAFAGMATEPPPPPTPSDPSPAIEPLPQLDPWPEYDPGAIDQAWLDAREAERVAAIEAGITEIFAALPDEDGLAWVAQLNRWQGAMGKIIAARTAIHAPALGIAPPSHDGACHNAVLHDRFDEDGVARHEGSYLARYYDGLRVVDLDERTWATLPALTGIVEGMRCLSEAELAGLEAAFVVATLETMQDLLDHGHPALAQVVWDQALPIELLLFDGVKSFTMPQGWRLLQASIGNSGELVVPELPAAGTDFDAYLVEDTTTCSTIRCGLYKGPLRDTAAGQGLTLDTLGAWLPDLTARNRLRRSLVHPESLLDAMVNLEVLGEGDCPLIELTFYNLTCKSERTCMLSTELADFEATSTEIRLGGLGSPYTHFGTQRADLAEANGCGSEAPAGSLPPSTCMGPQLRGARGRHMPLDPELDAVLTCTLQTYDGETPSVTPVQLDLPTTPGCFVSGGDGEHHDLDPAAVDEAMQQVADLLIDNDGAGRVMDFDRNEIIDILVAKTGAPADYVIHVLENRVGALFRSGEHDIRYLREGRLARSSVGHDSWGTIDMQLDVDYGQIADSIDFVTMGLDEADHASTADQLLFTIFLHEAIHLTLDYLYASNGWNVYEDADAIHHEITDQLGLDLESCDPNSTSCSTSCGYGDARMQRFSECLAGELEPFDRCVYEVDYCSDRRDGNLEYDAGLSCGVVTLPPLPPICLAVNCDSGSDLATACCGSSGPAGDPPPVGPIPAGPDPHPGDPDGVVPPVPSGPGGLPIPPFPPPPGL